MRTFILCVGAQKAGTTWLFKQIIKSPDFCKGFSKEYHLFDYLYLDGHKGTKNNIARRIRNYPFQDGEDFIINSEKRMLSFYDNPRNYFDYFDSILTEDTSFTSDITPSYSALSGKTFHTIKEEFNRRGIALKVIFIMREPISRLESAIKMQLRRKKTLRQTSNIDMAEKIRQAIPSSDNQIRSNYTYTCEQLDKTFNQKDIFYGFYETLFSEKEILRLSKFLDIDLKHFNSGNVVNSTAKLFKYNKQEIDNFKAMVYDRYQFVADRFGFDLSLWDQSLSTITAD